MRKFYDENLQHRYQHDPHFHNRVDHSEMAYSSLLKRAAEVPAVEGVHESMLQKYLGEENHPTYFFYGYLQPANRGTEKDLLLYLVKNFQPEPGVPFTFVYFNQQTPSSDFYFRFKSVFDLLPLRVIQKMRSFYLVKPYFYIKAFDMLGQANQVFAQAYKWVDNCHELVKREGFNVHEFVTFVPEEISEEFPSHLKRRPSLLTYRINVEGQSLSEDQLKEKQDFENSVRALITKEVYKLENYELGELGVPMVLQLLVGYFKEKPEALLQEGIFRKSVSIDEQNETLAELSSRNFGYLHQITNPHLIASLIKKFFTNLKEPVIPFAVFDRLMHDQGVANKREFVKQHLTTLPRLNFLSLMFVVDFLRKDVIPLEKETKMGAHNLSICFSPALMRSEKPSMADIVNASKAVTVTEIMINDFDAIFGEEQQRKKLFEKSMIDRSNDVKRNIKQELNINIDDRTSEEVLISPFNVEHPPTPIQMNLHPRQIPDSNKPKQIPQPQPTPKQSTLIAKEPSQPILSKEVYKAEPNQPLQPKETVPQHSNSEIITIQQQQIQVLPTLAHQSKSEQFPIIQFEEEEEVPRTKKSKQDLVQLLLKKQQKVDPTQSHSTPTHEQKVATTHSSINLHSQSDRN